MKLSINLTNYSWPGGPAQIATHLSDVARRADDAGIDTLWVDHLVFVTTGPWQRGRDLDVVLDAVEPLHA